MEENKLVKFEAGALQKLGNAIAITNKLLQKSFDYLKWWNDLDDNWKESFIRVSIFKVSEIELHYNFDEREYSRSESNFINVITNYKKGGRKLNNFVMNTEAIKFLLSFKKIEIASFGFKNNCDLTPLKLFDDIEELEIHYTGISSLKPLKDLKNLKLLDCSKIMWSDEEISKKEIEQFKKDHPNCKVIS